jgi:hypothetical protein
MIIVVVGAVIVVVVVVFATKRLKMYFIEQSSESDLGLDNTTIGSQKDFDMQDIINELDKTDFDLSILPHTIIELDKKDSDLSISPPNINKLDNISNAEEIS